MFVLYAFQRPLSGEHVHEFHYIVVLLAFAITFARLLFAPLVRCLKKCACLQKTEEIQSETIMPRSTTVQIIHIEPETIEDTYFNSVSFL